MKVETNEILTKIEQKLKEVEYLKKQLYYEISLEKLVLLETHLRAVKKVFCQMREEV